MNVEANGEVPKSVASYRGKLLSEMTREELIFALNDMAKREEEAREKYHGILMRTRHVRTDERAVPKADSAEDQQRHLSILRYFVFPFMGGFVGSIVFDMIFSR